MCRGPNESGPKCVGAQMSRGPNELGPKCVGAQMSRGPNVSGPKWVGAQMCWGPNESGAQMSGDQMSQGPKCVPAPLIISSCISSKWQHHNRYKYSSNNSLDTRVYKLLEGTFLPMLPEKLHRIVYLFSDLLREVIQGVSFRSVAF